MCCWLSGSPLLQQQISLQQRLLEEKQHQIETQQKQIEELTDSLDKLKNRDSKNSERPPIVRPTQKAF